MLGTRRTSENDRVIHQAARFARLVGRLDANLHGLALSLALALALSPVQDTN